MSGRWFLRLALLAGVCAVSAPAAASEWWYVSHGDDRVLFIDRDSIERKRDVATYWSKHVIRDAADPAASTRTFMQADCRKQQLGWLGVAKYDIEDRPLDTSTQARAEMQNIPPDMLGAAELTFVCSGVDEGDASVFPVAIDDVAFAEALLAREGGAIPPQNLHEKMARDPSVPVFRSSAPGVETFGQTQTVKVGAPIVPPRDYAKGPEAPKLSDYDPNTVGVIYDVAFQGVSDGEMTFEVRGYSPDDMVHPGSGQNQSFPTSLKSVNVRDIAITVLKVTPEAITYRVAIEKEDVPVFEDCSNGACFPEEATVATSATDR